MQNGRATRQLDYEQKKQELIEFLGAQKNANMALATSGNDRVMARPVSIAGDGLDIYFLTWKHSRKIEQIRSNPRVALCKDRIQIEGVAEILGDLHDPGNARHIEILRKKLPGTVERWQDRPCMIVVRVKPTFAAVGGSIDEEVWLDYVDVEKETAFSQRWAHY